MVFSSILKNFFCKRNIFLSLVFLYFFIFLIGILYAPVQRKTFNHSQVTFISTSNSRPTQNQRTAVHEAAHALIYFFLPEFIPLKGIYVCDSKNPNNLKEPFKTACDGRTKGFVHENVDDKKKYQTKLRNEKDTEKLINYHFYEAIKYAAGRWLENYFFGKRPGVRKTQLDDFGYFGETFKLQMLKELETTDVEHGTALTGWNKRVSQKLNEIIRNPKNLHIVHLLASALLAKEGVLLLEDIEYIYQNQAYPKDIKEKVSKEKELSLISHYKDKVKSVILNPEDYKKMKQDEKNSEKGSSLTIIIVASVLFVVFGFSFAIPLGIFYKKKIKQKRAKEATKE